MSISVLGAGALGSVVGALLARGGTDVALWDINDLHLEAIRTHGLRLDTPSGSEVIEIEVSRPDTAGSADVILLLTKTLYSEAALRGVERQLAEGAQVVSLQNGLGNAERVAQVVAPARVHFGCTMMPGRFIAPGHVATASDTDGRAIFRPMDLASLDQAHQIAAAAQGFAMQADVDEADRTIWQKAAFNCAMNAIMALQGGTIGHLGKSAEGAVLAKDTAAEVVAVAQASGVGASLGAVEDSIDHALAHHGTHKPSMLQDIEAGRETEIDALCGFVAQRGASLGIETPINKTLAALVRLKSAVEKEGSA